MEFEPLTRRNVGLTTAALLVVLTAVVLFRGVPMYSSEASCYTTVRICHGVPLDGCKGYESEEVRFLDKQDCGIVDNITARCDQLGEAICQLNNHSIGTTWAARSKAFGQTCEKWNELYDIPLKSC